MIRGIRNTLWVLFGLWMILMGLRGIISGHLWAWGRREWWADLHGNEAVGFGIVSVLCGLFIGACVTFPGLLAKIRQKKR